MLVAKKEMNFYEEERNYTHKKANKHNIRKKNQNQIKMKLKLFTSAFIILIICLTVLLKYAEITQSGIEIAKLKTEISDLEKQKQELVVDLEKIKESQWIENEAIEALGMMYPTQEQTLFVSISPDDIEEEIQETGVSKPVYLKAFDNIMNKVVRFIE